MVPIRMFVSAVRRMPTILHKYLALSNPTPHHRPLSYSEANNNFAPHHAHSTPYHTCLSVIMTTTCTRPHFPRSFSSGYDADGKHELVHGLRHTQSVPASYPSTRPWGQRRRALTSRPITPAAKPPLTRAHTHHHPERASTQPSWITASPDDRRLRHPNRGGVPMRRVGFGVEGPNAHQRPRLRRSPPATRRIAVRGAMHPPQAAHTLSDVLESENSDASSSDDDDDDDEVEGTNPYARYTFLPPGLSSPVPWDPETGFLPVRTPSVALIVPSRSRFPLGRRTSSMLSSTTIRPSVSRMGSHIHDHRLDHGPGGNADEDAFLRTPGPLLTPIRPVRSRGYSGLTVDALRAPTLSRFNSSSSCRL